jgi:hypothetical protein
VLAIAVRLRRWVGTLHAGHILKGYGANEPSLIYDFLDLHFESVQKDVLLIEHDPSQSIAGSTPLSHLSMALETGDDGRTHIQFYCEFKAPVYPKTLKEIFQCEYQPPHAKEVKNARGAYEYCTGTGRYHGKAAHARFQWGEARAQGSVTDSNLKVAVDLIVAGNHPHDIAKADPYAYACHSRKIWDLYQALRGKEIHNL